MPSDELRLALRADLPIEERLRLLTLAFEIDQAMRPYAEVIHEAADVIEEIRHLLLEGPIRREYFARGRTAAS
jgi:hypothetical protein